MPTSPDPRPTPEGAYGRTLEELLALCERAGAYKRQQLAERGIGTEFQRGMYIFHRTPRVKGNAPNADGWVHLSDLINDLEQERYRILWQPSDDRLRLQRA